MIFPMLTGKSSQNCQATKLIATLSIEHSFRMSQPDSYGVGLGMMGGMGGGMGINNLPGSQMLLYGRGMGGMGGGYGVGCLYDVEDNRC